MTSTTTPVIFKTIASVLLAALVAGPLMAQTSENTQAPAEPQTKAKTAQTGKIEGADVLPEGEAQESRSAVRSYQQDGGSRIEELRVHGQTREITVTPAGTMPSYEVVPGSSYSNSISSGRSSDGTNGPRRWKIGEF